MTQQDIDKLLKLAGFILAETGEAGYYADAEKTDPDTALIKLRLIDGYFDRTPSPADVKPIAQALRSGLIKRGYQVKGIKPGVVREGMVYFYTVRKAGSPER